MEIELKYRMKDGIGAGILDDEMVASISDRNREVLDMDSTYYDTEDRRLSQDGIALRVRRENENYMATLKWSGESEDGLHRRQEINIPLGEQFSRPVTAAIFEQSEMYDRLMELTGGAQLTGFLKTRFVRKQERLDSGTFICMISVDEGRTLAGGREEPFSELEIELYSGSESDMKAFGRRLAEKFGLEPENTSKYARGLALLEK